jgi:hypothetical protein
MSSQRAAGLSHPGTLKDKYSPCENMNIRYKGRVRVDCRLLAGGG